MTAVARFLLALYLSLHPWAPPPPLGGPWAVLRQCESGGRYNTVFTTGEPYGGAYQFETGTWRAHNHDYAYAYLAPYWVQDWEAYHLWLERSRFPWPTCGLVAFGA